MSELTVILAGAAPILLLLLGITPSHFANRHNRLFRGVAELVTWAVFLAAVGVAVLLAVGGPVDRDFISLEPPLPIVLGVYVDSLSAIMLLLVSFIGAVIARFSRRYLDGDHQQGRFTRWLLFTLGSVLTMVVANNLLQLTLAWMMTSFGLHFLLTHYADRPAAVLAARKKFLISRLGDAMLLGAMVLTYQTFGSFRYSVIFDALSADLAGTTVTWQVVLTGWLYAIGAMTKSAQFPFHSWLPDTMETPTPVSALMHAGIINAGGFLILRLSPLMSQSQAALDMLAMFGAATALLGAVVMLTQTSVKRALAYSTIAQMGFMMFQCGLGAYAAALLHIVAHSLYKAHAFLSSGTLMPKHALPQVTRAVSRPVALGMLLAAMLVSAGITSGVSLMIGKQASSNASDWILGGILVIALTHLLWKAFCVLQPKVAIRGVAAAVAVAGLYGLSYRMVEMMIASSIPLSRVSISAFDIVVMSMTALGFVLVFLMQESLMALRQTAWFRSLYVHVSNGLYLDWPAYRLTSAIWNRTVTGRSAG